MVRQVYTWKKEKYHSITEYLLIEAPVRHFTGVSESFVLQQQSDYLKGLSISFADKHEFQQVHSLCQLSNLEACQG